MAINLPFLSAHRPERPKTRELKLHEEVYVKKALESFPEILPELKGKVVSGIEPEHKLEVQPIYRYVISGARRVRRMVFPSTLSTSVMRETLDAIATPDPVDGKPKLFTDSYDIKVVAPPILVEFEALQHRRFYIPANLLETREQRQWRLDHGEDPATGPEPDPVSPTPPSPLPPTGSMALPLPEEAIDTNAVATQKART